MQSAGLRQRLRFRPGGSAAGGSSNWIGPLDSDSSKLIWRLLAQNPRELQQGPACVSWSWRRQAQSALEHALVMSSFIKAERPHVSEAQLIAALAPFESVPAICCRDCDWLTNEALLTLCRIGSWRSIDLSGCQAVTSQGVRSMVVAMGERLEGFTQDSTTKHALCRQMKVTMHTIKVISTAPKLQTLRLTLSSQVKSGALDCLSGARLAPATRPPRVAAMALLCARSPPSAQSQHRPTPTPTYPRATCQDTALCARRGSSSKASRPCDCPSRCRS